MMGLLTTTNCNIAQDCNGGQCACMRTPRPHACMHTPRPHASRHVTNSPSLPPLDIRSDQVSLKAA